MNDFDYKKALVSLGFPHANLESLSVVEMLLLINAARSGDRATIALLLDRLETPTPARTAASPCRK